MSKVADTMEKTVILLPESSLEKLEDCLKNIISGEEDKMNLMNALGLKVGDENQQVFKNHTDVEDNVDDSNLSLHDGASHSTDMFIKNEKNYDCNNKKEIQQNDSNYIDNKINKHHVETTNKSIVPMCAKFSEQGDKSYETDDQTKENNPNSKPQITGELKSVFECRHCLADFKSEIVLSNHIKNSCVSEDMVPYVEKIGDKYNCKICKYATNGLRVMRNIREHILITHKLFPRLKCFQCDKTFYYKYEIRKHAGVHKKVVCEECGKDLRSENSLKFHVILRHAPEEEKMKLFKLQCSGCDKRFYSQRNLREHEQIHGKRTALPCPQCDRTIASKHSLQQHIKREHLGHKKPKTEEEKAYLRAYSMKRRLEKKAENGGMRTEEDRRKGREWARRRRENERMKQVGQEDQE